MIWPESFAAAQRNNGDEQLDKNSWKAETSPTNPNVGKRKPKPKNNMKKQLTKPLFTSLMFAVMLLAADRGEAVSTYDYSTVLDLSSYSVYGGLELTWYFSIPQPTYTLKVGDTINGTITFANNQRIQITNPGGSFEDVYLQFGNVNTENQDTATTTSGLLGVQGPLDISNPYNNIVLGAGIIAPMEDGGPITLSSLSFSGFSYSITLTSLTSGGGQYTPVDFSVYEGSGADHISIISVPDKSSTFVLLGIASTCLALFCWKSSAPRLKRNPSGIGCSAR